MEDWTDEIVNKVFDSFLDEMDNHKANEVRNSCVTVAQKKSYLIEQEQKFEDSFK